MSDIVVGTVVILAGLVLGLRGYWAMRLVLSIWGALAGFGLGSGLVSSIRDEPYLDSALAWIVAIGLAIVFAAFAYLYYAIGVIFSLGSIGFVFGASVTVALGVDWNWVIVAIGIVSGVALALVAIATNLPALLLVTLSAIAGAGVTVGGAMLVAGVVTTPDFSSATVTSLIDDRWWWSVAFAALAVVGVVVQLRAVATGGGVASGSRSEGVDPPPDR